jgi:hypothetical protein
VRFALAHVLVGKSAPTPDQAGGKLFPEHALTLTIHSEIGAKLSAN